MKWYSNKQFDGFISVLGMEMLYMKKFMHVYLILL